MTRIIAGAAGGRRLSVPPGTRTRPTSDRAREGLFATITARHGPLDGTAFLDLYAGSGAVGLEALSRGAAPVLFVESDPAAARVIRANMTAVGLRGAELVTGSNEPGQTTRCTRIPSFRAGHLDTSRRWAYVPAARPYQKVASP